MMYAGVGMSGSPAPRSMTARPAARMAFARADAAMVADSRSSAMLGDRVNSDLRAEPLIRLVGCAFEARLYFEIADATSRAAISGHSGGSTGGTGREGYWWSDAQPERRVRRTARLGVDLVFSRPARR